MSQDTERLSDDVVAAFGGGKDHPPTTPGAKLYHRGAVQALAREVQASRKLMADLRALVTICTNVPIAELPSAGDVEAAVRRMIDEAGL